MSKLFLVLAALLLAASVAVFTQSNEVLDTLLEQEATTFAQAAYLILTATGRIPEEMPPAEAAAMLAEQGWTVPDLPPEEPLTLGEYSFLLMQAFDLEGGVMYRIAPGPRYACRELAYLGFIRKRVEVKRPVPGEEALYILGELLDWKELHS